MIQPKYAEIAAELRRRIRLGDFEPGGAIPSLRELAERWGCSEIVARQAVRVLVTEGLIETRPGAGTFVTEQRPLLRIAPHRYRRDKGATTYTEEARQADLEVRVDHETRQVEADRDVADRLNIEPGAMVSRTDYTIRMAGQPVSFSRCWEPLDITGGTDIEYPDQGPYGHLGIVDRFEKIGYSVREVEEVLTFRPPSSKEADRLKLPVGKWVVVIAQAFIGDERVLEIADIVYRPDRYAAFVYRLPIPTPESTGWREPSWPLGW